MFLNNFCFAGLKKKLNAASRLKECDLIGDRRKSIISHLYWSATSTPSGNGDIISAKFRSIVNHVKNKHEGHGEHPDVQSCAHGEIGPREWFREGKNLCYSFKIRKGLINKETLYENVVIFDDKLYQKHLTCSSLGWKDLILCILEAIWF